MKLLSQQVINDLQRLAGDHNLRKGNLRELLDEGIGQGNLEADVLVTPQTANQLADIIGFCNHNGICVIPQGGRTGLSGGAISRKGQIIVQTSKLNRIIDLDVAAGTLTVESGVKLEEAENAVLEHGYTLGVDLAARGSATIGGMVSTNAGGNRAFRNGTMRQRVLGIEAVLPNGRLFSDLKKVIKANEGYDIKQLLIGAEGTLGIVTKIVLNLLPDKPPNSTALVHCDSAQSAVKMYQMLRAQPNSELLSAEIMWPLYASITAAELNLEKLSSFMQCDEGVFVIIELFTRDDNSHYAQVEHHLEELLDAGLITNALIARNAGDARDFWAVREESFLCDKRYPHGYWFDVSVPLGLLDEYSRNLFEKIKQTHPDLKVFLFGHLGDGNLHITVSSGRACAHLESRITNAVYQDLKRMGGSFSAEHGLGNEKVCALQIYADEQKLQLMRAIKTVVDPNGILNPGKVLAGNSPQTR